MQSMTISDIMNVITEVESTAPVEQWTSGGVHVWPLIRIQLGRDILSRYKLINPNHPNRGGLWERAGTILGTMGSIWKQIGWIIPRARGYRHSRSDLPQRWSVVHDPWREIL